MTIYFKVDEDLPDENTSMLRSNGVQPERPKENSRGQRPRSKAPSVFLDPERVVPLLRPYPTLSGSGGGGAELLRGRRCALPPATIFAPFGVDAESFRNARSYEEVGCGTVG